MAEHAHSTPTPPPHDPSRRAILAGIAGVGAATLASTALVAAQPGGEAPSRDVALIAACTEYHRAHALWHGPYINDDVSMEHCQVRQDAMEAVAEMVATTPEGLRAKAGVAHSAVLFQASPRVNVPWREQATVEQTLAIDVLAGLAMAAEGAA